MKYSELMSCCKRKTKKNVIRELVEGLFVFCEKLRVNLRRKVLKSEIYLIYEEQGELLNVPTFKVRKQNSKNISQIAFNN